MVSRPEGKSVVYSIWIYKIQHAVDDNIMGYKEIFVAWGFSWKEGIDYEETFAATRKTHDKKNHVCKWKKALYELRRHPWDNTYMMSLKITYSDEDLNLCYKVEDEIL